MCVTLKSLAFSANGKMGTEVGRQEGEKERTGERGGREREEMREVGKRVKAGMVGRAHGCLGGQRGVGHGWKKIILKYVGEVHFS